MMKGLVVSILVTAHVSAAGAQLIIRQENPVPIRYHWVGQLVLDTLAIWSDVAAPAEKTFAAALQVLDTLGLPVERADSARSVAFHSRLVASGKLARRAVSQSLRCGGGITGDHADVWRVSIAYAVYVDRVAPDRSRVGVALFARALDTQGVSKPPIICGSKGALEHEISRRVREAVESR